MTRLDTVIRDAWLRASNAAFAAHQLALLVNFYANDRVDRIDTTYWPCPECSASTRCRAGRCPEVPW